MRQLESYVWIKDNESLLSHTVKVPDSKLGRNPGREVGSL